MSEISSEQINELATALAKAQGAMKNAEMNKTNPHFKSKYADLAAVREATIPALSANGLAIIQFTEAVNAGMLLHTRLLHASGQWIDSSYVLAADLTKPQSLGSAITYGRRYGWVAMCGIASEEDDDGNAAQAQAKGNGNGNSDKADQSTVYTQLVNSLRSTRTEAEYQAWKEKHGRAVAGLNDIQFPQLQQAAREHRASFAASPMVQAWPPEIKETAKVTTKATPFQDEVPF